MRNKRTRLLRDLLRLKRDYLLCDKWEEENFGYWGNAPQWAEDALTSVSTICSQYPLHLTSPSDCFTRGKINLLNPLDGCVGDIYTFCRAEEDIWEVKWEIRRNCRRRGLKYEDL